MNHNWYAVITAPVLLSKDLTDKQKLLIALIGNLSNEKGYCFAGNKYLSDCLNCSERYIQENISVLEEKKILGRVIKLNDKKEVEYRAVMLTLETLTPMNHSSPPHEPQFTTPPEPQFTHNNINIKTNNNNSLISNEESVDSSESGSKDIFGAPINPTSKPKSKKTKKDSPRAHPAFKPMVDFFCKDYWPDYQFFGARDGKAINDIIKQIEKILSNHGEDMGPENVIGLFKAVVSGAPAFYQKKSLPVINSKFSEIIEEIKKQQNGQTTKQSAYSEARDFVNSL